MTKDHTWRGVAPDRRVAVIEIGIAIENGIEIETRASGEDIDNDGTRGADPDFDFDFDLERGRSCCAASTGRVCIDRAV
jgi:hypothetical protein